MLNCILFLGQLWTLDDKGILENRYVQNWKYCKKIPWIIPEEGKEGFVKIGHEPDKHGYHGYLGQEVDTAKVDLMPKSAYGYSWIWERSSADEMGCFTLKNKKSGGFLTAFAISGLSCEGKYLKKKKKSCLKYFFFHGPLFFFQIMKVITKIHLAIIGRI